MKPQINTDEHGLGDITFKINGCAMDVLNTIGHGFHEKIYENALALAFKKRELAFSQQSQFDQIIVELKTIDRMGNNEKGQVLNYLRASGLRLGMILNFKNPKLDWQRVAL